MSTTWGFKSLHPHHKKASTTSTCFFCCSSKSNLKGLELERKKNSGHPLFLAADRSILQSKRFELVIPDLQNARIQVPKVNITSKSGACLINHIVNFRKSHSRFLFLLFREK